MMKIKVRNLIPEAYTLIVLMISMAGFIPKNSNIIRLIIMIFSFITSLYISNYQINNFDFAISYFIIFLFLYIFINVLVLSENGYRKKMILEYGEERAFQKYQTLMGFLFFHNAVSLGSVASASPSSLFNFIHPYLFYTLVIVLFCIGLTVKVWAAKVAGIDIYYWKDMFLGRKISEFVSAGPYKYLSNPMYGIGHLQGYAFAIWHQSLWGLGAVMLNQAMVFAFYYFVEIKFITKVYKPSSS